MVGAVIVGNELSGDGPILLWRRMVCGEHSARRVGAVYERVAGGGTYRFTANAGAVSNGATLHLEIDGAVVQGGVAVPNTGRSDVFGYAYLGSKTMSAGKHNLRVVFETGGISLDWFM